MRSEVADATANVKYNRSSLWTSPSSVLVTGVLLKASLTMAHGKWEVAVS